MATSVSDLAFIDSTGFTLADFPTFLAYVQSNYQTIYGADIYLGADSLDGQWTAIQAQDLYDACALAQAVYNSFAPSGAQGAGLSRLVKINGLNREVPTFSTAVVTIVGQSGTVITNGIAIDTVNQQWNLPTTVTIPSGGSINVTATAKFDGSVTAGSGTITGIFTPTLGWQSITNANAATPGQPVETDGQLRARQAISTANPSLTVLDGTFGAVANVTGVTATAVWENYTASTDANGQPSHSIFVVVQGGSIPDVAQAIQIHKTPGTFPWAGPAYTFSVVSANATIGATYTNNGTTFTVVTTIAGGTTLVTTSAAGSPPTASGTLTKSSGTGDSTITYSSFINEGGNAQSETVFDSEGMPITIGFFQPPLIARIGVQVTITIGGGWSDDFETTIAAQISTYIDTLGIGAGQQFGGSIQIPPLYFQAYIPNYSVNQYVVDGIQIKLNSGSFGTSALAISYTQLPTCSPVVATDVVFVKA